VRKCHYCKRPGGKGPRELRPYGPGGADVCAECAIGVNATPERTRTAEKMFREKLSQKGPLVLDSRERVGPRRMGKRGAS
jgi:hypothetical protein